jgi:hypothetical protein
VLVKGIFTENGEKTAAVHHLTKTAVQLLYVDWSLGYAAGMDKNIWVGMVGLAGVLLLTGCAAAAPLAGPLMGGVSPAATLQIQSETHVKLESSNFVTVRTNVVGESKGFKLLGFITLYPATLNKAMNRLYAEARAEEGHSQTLANLMVEHSGIYVVLFSIPRVTARADLIEFVPPPAFGVGGRRPMEMGFPDSSPP